MQERARENQILHLGEVHERHRWGDLETGGPSRFSLWMGSVNHLEQGLMALEVPRTPPRPRPARMPWCL